VAAQRRGSPCRARVGKPRCSHASRPNSSSWFRHRGSLPFKVQGYFDLRGSELVDKPGERFSPYVFVVRSQWLRG
jgi:hypothetical protein